MGQKSDKNVKSREDLEAELKRRSLSEIVSGCESSMRRYLYHYYNQETILLHQYYTTKEVSLVRKWQHG